MRAARLSLLLMLALPGVLLALRPEPPGRDDLPAGLTPAQVRERLGPPAHVSRALHEGGALEQWHYRRPTGFSLEFDCPRGEVPRLLARRPAR